MASRNPRLAPAWRDLPAPVILFADQHIVIVDKPAGLTTMRHAYEAAEFGPRGRRYLPPTLADLLPPRLQGRGRPGRVRAVHRLDKETSGLVVFARTPAAERSLLRATPWTTSGSDPRAPVTRLSGRTTAS